MNKRIAIFCDGTRNTREDETSVHRLYEKVRRAAHGVDGRPQAAWYDQGVGTRATDFLTGAVWGRGVSQNVREAYEKVRSLWEPGDDLFLFGFSRGAFTARSLAGFIAQYGMLEGDASLRLKDLYRAYRKADSARPIYRLKRLAREGEPITPFERRVVDDCEVIDVRFTGVWDTVGTVGLPIGHVWRVSAEENRFHTMEPRAIFRECCQALAVDEMRPHYRPILWKRWVNDADLDRDGNPPAASDYEDRFEQRWFVGAHSNVGGGYRNPSALYRVPLKWMEDRALAAGLGVSDRTALDGTEHFARINDSFREFVPYKLAFWIKRQIRPVLRRGEKKVAKRSRARGSVFTLREVVDETVLDRMRRGGGDGTPYEPRNPGIPRM